MSGPMVSYREMTKLKYTRNFLHEIFRRYNLIYTIARTPNEHDIELFDGKIIKKGVGVMISNKLIQLDERNWPNPDVFDPDRFEDSSNKLAPKFFPFGYPGNRYCPGRSLAYAEGVLMVASTLKHYDVKVTDPHPGYVYDLIS